MISRVNCSISCWRITPSWREGSSAIVLAMATMARLCPYRDLRHSDQINKSEHGATDRPQKVFMLRHAANYFLRATTPACPAWGEGSFSGTGKEKTLATLAAATQPEAQHELGTVHATGERLASQTENPSPLTGKAVAVKHSRWDDARVNGLQLSFSTLAVSAAGASAAARSALRCAVFSSFFFSFSALQARAARSRSARSLS